MTTNFSNMTHNNNEHKASESDSNTSCAAPHVEFPLLFHNPEDEKQTSKIDAEQSPFLFTNQVDNELRHIDTNHVVKEHEASESASNASFVARNVESTLQFNNQEDDNEITKIDPDRSPIQLINTKEEKE
jgi:hypothetical protein